MRGLFQHNSDTKTPLKTLLAKVQELNERIQHDQTEIDRLKKETRVISQRTDMLMRQIEAELDMLRKADG